MQDRQNTSIASGLGLTAGLLALVGGTGNDGWGDLPTHVPETSRSEGRSELPARYRDWIDDDYRKMNTRGPRG